MDWRRPTGCHPRRRQPDNYAALLDSLSPGDHETVASVARPLRLKSPSTKRAHPAGQPRFRPRRRLRRFVLPVERRNRWYRGSGRRRSLPRCRNTSPSLPSGALVTGPASDSSARRSGSVCRRLGGSLRATGWQEHPLAWANYRHVIGSWCARRLVPSPATAGAAVSHHALQAAYRRAGLAFVLDDVEYARILHLARATMKPRWTAPCRCWMEAGDVLRLQRQVRDLAMPGSAATVRPS